MSILKLIVSAYRAGATQQENARQTANLITATSDFDVCLVQGSYHGHPEVSLQITGFEDIEHLHQTAMALCRGFKQTCVYYSVYGDASLLHSNGEHESIGKEIVYPPHMVNTVMFKRSHSSYTVYPDGSALAVLHALEAAA